MLFSSSVRLICPNLGILIACVPFAPILSAQSPVQNPANGHHYLAVPMAGLNWQSARAAAQAMTFNGVRGHLATITSASENAFVLSLFNGQVVAGEVWLGGFQPTGSPEPAGGWQWITGEPWVYTNWNPGEPTNSGPTGENALMMWTGTNVGSSALGKWNDFGAEGTAHFSPISYVVEFDTEGQRYDVRLELSIPATYTTGPPQARCRFGRQLYFTYGVLNDGMVAVQTVAAIPDESIDADGADHPLSAGNIFRAYADDALADGQINTADNDSETDDCHLLHRIGLVQPPSVPVVTRLSPQSIAVRLSGSVDMFNSTSPLPPFPSSLSPGAPDADWEFTLTIDTSGTVPTWKLSGSHDGFPAFKLSINNSVIYNFDPGVPPYRFQQLFRLYPPLEEVVQAGLSGRL